jgi:alpha-tubulin suppressor-like RCC1 family protein
MKHRLLLSFVMTTCTLIAAGCATRTDLKKGLLRAVKGADLRGYTLAQSEDDSQATASFTSAAIKDTMTFTGDGTVVVRYRAVHDKKNGTTTNYRDDIVRKGRLLTFVMTDLGTNRVIGKQSLAIPADDPGGGGDGGLRCFTSCSDAEQDFNLNQRPALQDAANRTCQTQRGGYQCCDNPPSANYLEVLKLISPTPHLQHILPACEVASLPFQDVSSQGPTLVPLKARVVGGGDNHSLAIAENGAVLAWGSNASGQLGDGTRTTRVHPGEVHGLCANSNVVAVAGGRSFSLALELDGTVLTWGTGGDGKPDPQLTPVPIGGLGTGAKVFAIAAGSGHALALKTDGTVWAWGKNQNGQLGIGNPDPPITNSSKPLQVTGLDGVEVQAIAASGTVSAALTSDGRVFTWGYNAFGQLGLGGNDFVSRSSPVEVKLLGSGVRAIVIGAYSVALKLDGSVFTWGTNSFGSLGDGSSPDVARTSPEQVIAPGSGIFAIAGGARGSHVLARKDDHTVLAWGANSAGQLGDNTTVNRFVPTEVPGLTDVVEVAVGGSHSLARKSDGTVLAWGSNGSGQLGNGSIQASVSFVNVANLGTGTPIRSVSACATHALALRSDGSVLAWGSNGSGQLGNHNPASSFVPVLVKNLPPMKAVACGVGGGGGGHSLALTADGRKVFAWGANTNGQLGDGTKNQRTDPVEVDFPTSDSRITAIAAGGLSFSLALKEDGTVWAWGTDGNGQVGNGDPPRDEPSPVQVDLSGSRVTAISAGNHGLALKEDGTVWAWGGNTNGQLGIGNKMPKTAPVQIVSLDPSLGPRVTAIEAAANYSLARRAGGSVVAWGANTNGQLGLPIAITESLTPVLVSTLAGQVVDAISIDRSEGSSSFATLKNGTVLGFGSNASGQLADGTFDPRVDARPIDYPFGPDPEVTVRAGTGFLLVLGPNGALSAVGTDAYGQLGDGQNTTKNQTPSPVLVWVNP